LLHNLTFERVKELLIIIPAAHIFLCFCYLFFYYSSFGYGIWLYSSPTDVFSVSFSDVAPGYLALFAGMAVGQFAFYSPPKMDGETAGIPLYTKIALWSIMTFIVVSIALTIVTWFRSGFLLYYLIMAPVALPVGLAWRRWGRNLTTNVTMLNIGIAASMAVVVMAFRGLGDGQTDRSGSIAEVGADKPTCSDKTVLRALSSNFLAAARDNSRVIIDQDCKVKFTLFAADRFVPRPIRSPIEIAFGRQANQGRPR